MMPYQNPYLTNPYMQQAIAIIRDMLSTANPETRAQIRSELSGLMSM